MKISKQNIFAKSEKNGFGGIDRTSPSKTDIAYDCVNFRVLSDGSAEKRPGYTRIGVTDGNARAVWSGITKSGFSGFVLAGSNVYEMDFTDRSLTLRGSIDTSEGRASFFCYMGSTYLLDGERIYHVGSDGVRYAEGYAPLIGKDWPTGYLGEDNEPLNMMTRRVRITYIVGDVPTIYLRTKYHVKTVDALYLNGVLQDPSAYSYHDDYLSIYYVGLETNDRVEVYLTLADSVFDNSALLASTGGTVFGGVYNSRVFMWNGNTMYCSQYVTPADVAASSFVYPEEPELYIRENTEFTVGEGRFNITAVNRHYDRLLIFTEGDTWMADSSACGTEEYPVMTINSSFGCRAVGATVKCGNDPVTVGNGTIQRWTSDTDKMNDCNAYSISGQIDGILEDSFYENTAAFCDTHSGELLFSNPYDETGTCWVYGLSCDKWYRYTGIGAVGFFDADGSCGFIRGNGVYVFDRERMYDYPDGVNAYTIEASLELTPDDFGKSDAFKRMLSISIAASGTGELDAEIRECGITIGKAVFMLYGGENTDERPIYCTKRITSPRFRAGTLHIQNGDGGRPRIFSVGMTAKR